MPEKPRSQVDWRTLLAGEFARRGTFYCKIAYGIVRDQSAAEDACQQAFVNALPRHLDLRCEESLRAWLVKVVVNESLVIRRRRRLEERALIGRVGARGAVESEIGDWELRDAVHDALEKLQDPMRTIVVMRLLDQMTGGEVAAAMSCSVSYVSRQLQSGMAILRVALEAWKAGTEAIK